MSVMARQWRSGPFEIAMVEQEHGSAIRTLLRGLEDRYSPERKKAVIESLKVVQKELKARVAVRTGATKRSIGRKLVRSQRYGWMGFVRSRGRAHILRFLRTGVSGDVPITPVRRKALFFEGSTGPVFAMRAVVPGGTRRSSTYFDDAIRAAAPQVERIVADALAGE